MTDLKIVRIQTRTPRGTDPGAIEECRYAVDDDHVQLYDMQNMSMGPNYRRKLPPHLAPSQLASVMLRETVGKRRSDFTRVLRYQKLVY
jgi:hypothetical protein